MNQETAGCIDPSLCALASDVVLALRRAKVSLVTAESCTGGLIAALLSHGARASDCLHGGFVVYTKDQKSTALGVSRALLSEFGAVTSEVARAMATGALERSPASWAVSVTGVLGPDPDEDDNPPGLVYIGTASRGGEIQVIRRHYEEEHPDLVRRSIIVEVLTTLQRQAAERHTSGQ
jgi:nicotinamide-nucleotide amidase